MWWIIGWVLLGLYGSFLYLYFTRDGDLENIDLERDDYLMLIGTFLSGPGGLFVYWMCWLEGSKNA